jgi:hypothetical protein
MNKNEAIKKAKHLQNELDFNKENYESEIKKLTDDVTLYKAWFKTAREDNKNHIKKINEQFRELEVLKKAQG